jgi:hypothetical protein
MIFGLKPEVEAAGIEPAHCSRHWDLAEEKAREALERNRRLIEASGPKGTRADDRRHRYRGGA